MEKILIRKPGGYEQLQFQTFENLQPKPGEVIVQNKAIGVNYADVCVRWGVYESAKKYIGWPITPGFEFAGIVKEVGPGVSRLSVGDKVFGITRFGAYATDIAVQAELCFPLPEGFTFEEAAAFPAVFMTAYHALFQIIRIRRGAKLLIHSAAGGVGTALLQLAKLSGFKTVAIVGASHKITTAKEFGADEVIDKSEGKLWKKVEALEPSGFDVILDANGPETLKESFEHLAPTGKLIVYGYTSMLPRQGGKLDKTKLLFGFLKTPKFSPFDLVTLNRSVIGFNVSFLFDKKELIEEGLTQLLHWVKEGKIIPPKVTTFPLRQVAEAHKKIESGQSVGKLVLVP